MKIITKNGIIYNNLNISIIKDLIKIVKTLVAVIADDRKLSYKDNEFFKEFIDDLTQEELNKGLKEVENICKINNELDLLKEYYGIFFKDDDINLLAKLKELKFVDIKLKAEKLSHELLVDEVPDSEVATFTTQRSEAIAYRNSGYTNDNLCPMLKIIAEIRAMSLRDLVDKCLLKSSLYETELAKILGKRQKLEDDIKKAQTLEELNLIVW